MGKLFLAVIMIGSAISEKISHGLISKASLQQVAKGKRMPFCRSDSSKPGGQFLKRLSSGLVMPSLAAGFLSGCMQLPTLDRTDDKAIYSYDYKDARTLKTVHEAGLISRHLIEELSFRVNVPQITLVSAGKGDGGLNPSQGFGPKSRCVVSGNMKIRTGAKKGEYLLQAELRSPLAYLDSKTATAAEHIESWIRECDCPEAEAEITGSSCFGRRFAATVLGKLRAAAVKPDAELSHDMGERIVREVGSPFVSYDRLLMGERGAALPGKSRALLYLMQRLNPGEDLCFQVSSYSTTWIKKFNTMGSIAEPASPACFPWVTMTRSDYRTNLDMKGEVAIGIDPLGRVGPAWEVENSSARKGLGLLDGNESDLPHDRLVTIADRVSNLSDTPFRFAILFVSNRFSLIPNGPERDMQVSKVDATPSEKNLITRGSFLLLIRDSRLADYIQGRVAKPNNKCSNYSMQILGEIHQYLQCLTREWGRSQDITIKDQYKNWILNAAFPSNLRPFVRLEILVDDQAEKVRVGNTLLNLIDRRLNLSAQVFGLRQRTNDPQAAETPGVLEARLIEEATKQLSYERRNGVQFHQIDLRRAQRLEDLLVPLNSGDRVTWH